MQKATDCNGLTVYCGYSNQHANGLGYDVSQQKHFSAFHVECDNQRSACFLQSCTDSATLHKLEDCSQNNGAQDILGANDRLSLIDHNNLAQNPSNGQNVKKAEHGSLTSATRKQIFSWMKESRQNTKQQKSNRPFIISGDYNISPVSL